MVQENTEYLGFVHEKICRWLETQFPADEAESIQIQQSNHSCCNQLVLGYLEAGFAVGDGFTYQGYETVECEVISSFVKYVDKRPYERTGAYRFRFANETGDSFDVLYASAWISDEELCCTMVAFASVPKQYATHWLAFEKECNRIAISAMLHLGEVYVVGGTSNSFSATTNWDDIVLPDDIKSGILDDIDAFFEKGVAIYDRLNINPFRKLLLAGVPGTGKTMLCSAIAKWALDKGYFVCYVSGADYHGAEFWKVHRALDMASTCETRAIILVEEFDSYLNSDAKEVKAQLLNVLDGSETPTNPHGTVMIATTNHPEKIDNRVMKRPGRIDRVFIIPEQEHADEAERMLRNYLSDLWQDDHRTIVPELIGKPGAFIREVSLYALTMGAYRGHDDLPLSILQESVNTLSNQIDAKENFLTAHKSTMGLVRTMLSNGKSHP